MNLCFLTSPEVVTVARFYGWESLSTHMEETAVEGAWFSPECNEFIGQFFQVVRVTFEEQPSWQN